MCLKKIERYPISFLQCEKERKVSSFPYLYISMDFKHHFTELLGDTPLHYFPNQKEKRAAQKNAKAISR
jgi:hypothetical protein